MSLVQHKFTDESIIGALGGKRTGVIHVGVHELENTLMFSYEDVEVMAKAIGLITDVWNDIDITGCPPIAEEVTLLINNVMQEGAFYIDACDPSDLCVEYFWVSKLTGDTIPIMSGQKWKYCK